MGGYDDWLIFFFKLVKCGMCDWICFWVFVQHQPKGRVNEINRKKACQSKSTGMKDYISIKVTQIKFVFRLFFFKFESSNFLFCCCSFLFYNAGLIKRKFPSKTQINAESNPHIVPKLWKVSQKKINKQKTVQL